MHILLLSRYDRLGASSRLRLLQYIPALESAGIQVTISPFFKDSHLRYFYRTSKRRWYNVVDSYYRRISALLRLSKFSLIWLEKEVFPFLPGWFEGWLKASGIPYIVDYDDATFHTYDQHRLLLVRRLLGSKLDTILRGASVVTVGNPYLQSYMRKHGATCVELIPTVIDMERYFVTSEPGNQEFRIGWIGTPKTSSSLELIKESLTRLAQRRSIRLVTIGAPPIEHFDLPLEQHPWSLHTEASLLSSIHAGIMPLPDDPWSKGKCGYKLIQYMACGRPVVASPIGVNQDIVTVGQNGYLASTPEDWENSIESLIADPVSRQKMGGVNRKKVESIYSIQAQAPRLISIFQEVLS